VNIPCVGIFAMHLQGIQKQNAVQKKNVGANIYVTKSVQTAL
jgi:hypothetical protein